MKANRFHRFAFWRFAHFDEIGGSAFLSPLWPIRLCGEKETPHGANYMSDQKEEKPNLGQQLKDCPPIDRRPTRKLISSAVWLFLLAMAFIFAMFARMA